MAERAAVWYGRWTSYDEAAVAKHLTAAAAAPLADGARSSPRWRMDGGRLDAALACDAAAELGSAWARSRSRCGSR